jgi:hypothetical protein
MSSDSLETVQKGTAPNRNKQTSRALTINVSRVIPVTTLLFLVYLTKLYQL